MRREERVTVQGPVKEQQPDGMSHRGLAVRCIAPPPQVTPPGPPPIAPPRPPPPPNRGVVPRYSPIPRLSEVLEDSDLFAAFPHGLRLEGPKGGFRRTRRPPSSKMGVTRSVVPPVARLPWPRLLPHGRAAPDGRRVFVFRDHRLHSAVHVGQTSGVRGQELEGHGGQGQQAAHHRAHAGYALCRCALCRDQAASGVPKAPDIPRQRTQTG